MLGSCTGNIFALLYFLLKNELCLTQEINHASVGILSAFSTFSTLKTPSTLSAFRQAFRQAFIPTDGPTDGPSIHPTDGHDLLWSCERTQMIK